VSVALYSAKYAAETIERALQIGDTGHASLKYYEIKLSSGIEVWYEFIRLYYKLLPLFTHFIRSKEHRLEILRLLQGEVFNRDDVPVLVAMREYIETVERTEGHVFHNHLADIPIDDHPLPD